MMKRFLCCLAVFISAFLAIGATTVYLPSSAGEESLVDVTSEFSSEKGQLPKAITFESDTFLKNDGLILCTRLEGAYSIEFDAATTADGSAELGGTVFLATFGNASATEEIGGDAQIGKEDCVSFVAQVGGIHTGRNDYTASGHKIWNDKSCTQAGTYNKFVTEIGAYFTGNFFFRFRFDVTNEGTIDIYAKRMDLGTDLIYLNTIGFEGGSGTSGLTDGYFSLLSATKGVFSVMNFKVNGEEVSFEGENPELTVFGTNNTAKEQLYFADNTRMSSEFLVNDSNAADGDVLFDISYGFQIIGAHGGMSGGGLSISFMFGMSERGSAKTDASYCETKWAVLLGARKNNNVVGSDIPSNVYLINGVIVNVHAVGKKGGTLEVTVTETSPYPQQVSRTYTGLDLNGYMAIDVNDVTEHGDDEITVFQSFSVKVDEDATEYRPTGVQFEKSAITVPMGGEVKPVCSVLPAKSDNKTLTFVSSDTSIATVSDDGTITGVSRGQTTVTATSFNGKSGSITVVVTQPVTGVSLDVQSLELFTGEHHQLTATVIPDTAQIKDVVYSSSNIGIVQVSGNGFITAVSGGEAIVTVTTVDGQLTASCTVTVKEPVSGVKLDVNYLEISVGETITVSATVNPSTASDKSVTYTSSDASIATVTSDGKITALKEGEVVITVTTAEGSYTDECVVKVNPKASGNGCTSAFDASCSVAIVTGVFVVGLVISRKKKHE